MIEHRHLLYTTCDTLRHQPTKILLLKTQPQVADCRDIHYILEPTFHSQLAQRKLEGRKIIMQLMAYNI